MTEDKTIKGNLYGVPVTATIKGNPDYTPTTEEVSGAYNFWLQKCSDETVDEISEKFDRWLAEVKAEAWEEGYNAKWVETYFYDNPYREGENSE